jgi:hypothetical protein
MLAMR